MATNLTCWLHFANANNFLQKAESAVKIGDKLQAKAYLESAKQKLKQARDKIDECSENRGEALSQFQATAPSYSEPLCGPGFSGSLIVQPNDDESYNVVGIYSGPLFTEEIKNLIRNAGQHHHENYGQESSK
jgi:hypothetical protein